MLLLLVAQCIVNIFQPGLYIRAFRSIPTTKERDSIFVGSGSDNRSRIALNIYDLLMLGMVLLWCAHGGDNYSMHTFWVAVGMAAIALLLRWFMQVLVAYIFYERGTLDAYERHYRYLKECAMLLLYPIMLLTLFTDVPAALTITLLSIIAALYYGFLIFKMIALTPTNLHSFYSIPLFLITVEVLPLLAALLAAIHWL